MSRSARRGLGERRIQLLGRALDVVERGERALVLMRSTDDCRDLAQQYLLHPRVHLPDFPLTALLNAEDSRWVWQSPPVSNGSGLYVALFAREARLVLESGLLPEVELAGDSYWDDGLLVAVGGINAPYGVFVDYAVLENLRRTLKHSLQSYGIVEQHQEQTVAPMVALAEIASEPIVLAAPVPSLLGLSGTFEGEGAVAQALADSILVAEDQRLLEILGASQDGPYPNFGSTTLSALPEGRRSGMQSQRTSERGPTAQDVERAMERVRAEWPQPRAQDLDPLSPDIFRVDYQRWTPGRSALDLDEGVPPPSQNHQLQLTVSGSGHAGGSEGAHELIVTAPSVTSSRESATDWSRWMYEMHPTVSEFLDSSSPGIQAPEPKPELVGIRRANFHKSDE